MKKLIITPNGSEEVDMTAEEIAQAETDATNAETLKQEQETAKTNLANLKTSAKAKLVAGTPLTEEEANVMIGG